MTVDASSDGEYIDATAVAQRLGVAGRSQVNGYLHRYADFPRPVAQLGPGHRRLWRRTEIESWARAWRPTSLAQA